jgi:hypothetical protein
LSTLHFNFIHIKQNQPSTSTSQECGEENIKPPAKRKLPDYFPKADDTLDDILARMTALDGLPFSVFVTSNDLRKLLLAKGYSDLPKSASTIRSRVLNYCQKIKNDVKTKLKQLKMAGESFSLTFDEWTSTSNKRYMNINIHVAKKFWSLGLIRINVSMTAENCIRILKERLEQFDVSLETDVVAIVTDGPNIMLKVGKLIAAEHQVCFAYGIHLAVCDVLYNKKNLDESKNESAIASLDDDDEADENVEDVHCQESGLIIETDQNVPDLTNDENINEVIKKVRKVVLYFKRSPTKNDTVFQKYVTSEHGKELSLLLDCKTRWNSLLTMLERFALLKASIQKALIDLNHPVRLEDSDFDLINEIIDVLVPVKLTVDALGRRDANLCTADAALKFLFKQLNEKKLILANKMKTSLLDRLKQRRRMELSGVLNYLQSPRTNDEGLTLEIRNFFSNPNDNMIRSQIISLIQRVSASTTNKYDDEEEEEDEEIESGQLSLTLEEKLEAEIKRSMQNLEPQTRRHRKTDLMKTIKKEINLLETGTRGYHLELAYKYLISIPPTSIEPERAFSAAAYIGNKLRTRLGEDTLNALLFLRSYFRNLK